MVNTSMKNSLVEQFKESIRVNVEANLADLELEQFCKSGNMSLVKEAVKKIMANITMAIPKGYAIPKASLYVNGTGDGTNITVISISLTNGWKDVKEFKFSIQVPVDAYVISVIASFFEEAYTQLFLDMLVEENLEVINALYAEMTEKAGVQYAIKVVSPLNQSGKKLAYIADDEVYFVADPERVFDIDDILVFQAPDGMLITEEMIEKAKTPLIDEIGLAQTTVQVVGIHGGSLLKFICVIGTQVKAITLIRKVNNKNATRLTGKKDCTAYYAEGDVYSVVARRDGKFEVLLKPFDVKTLAGVDMDVLSKISA